ncbi:MAG: HEAT repeat domain-containing protein, partial [Phycisphaerales bacterium]
AHIGEDPRMEALILERLLKYEDPSDFRQAIAGALGTIGTQQALDALITLMHTTTDSGIRGACVTAVGRLSGKFHDTRAVKDLVSLYRSVPKSRGTGAPEEILQRMPPGFQANVILALSKMSGPEALAALDELHAAENDPVLLERLANARRDVQERLERNKADKDTDENAGG